MGLKWWYRVLYSSQLGKKNKSWADGYVYFVVALRRVVLLDEAGRTLDSGSDVLAGDLQVGGELKLQNHLVSVDEGPIPEPLHFASSRPSHAASLPRQEDCGVAAEAPSRDPQRLAAKRIFAILYTKDKQRKTKRWLDGYVLLAPNAAIFHGDDGKVIMRKAVENENDIYDGAAFESGTFCIEITSPLDRVPPAPDRPGTDPKVGEELRPAYACDIEEDEATFSMVYTEDLIRKQKRWHDGTVVYRKCDELCRFSNSEGELIYKRKVQWSQIDGQEEVKAGRYIFQMGERCADAIQAAKVEAKTSKKLKQMGAGEDEIEEADSNLFMEFEVDYTRDLAKKNKCWSTGSLWYTAGECKVFDEDGKQILRRLFKSESIQEGLELQHGKHLITVGPKKHQYVINETATAAQQQPADTKMVERPMAGPKGRSADQLEAFFAANAE